MSNDAGNPIEEALGAPAADLELATESALVEVLPGTALVFGKTPEGLDLLPFRLISPADQVAIAAAVSKATSIFNVGAQLAAGLAQTQGLVRLAPQTLAAMEAGATPIQSGGYNIGVLAGQSGRFAAQVLWLPAESAQAVEVAASIGPALALLAIQAQLNEIAGLVRENIALTETVLKTVRHEQWAELSGLEQAVTKALAEATAVGEVSPLLWENIAGYEAPIQKQRDLFRRNVEAHLAELTKQPGYHERRQYVERNGEAVLLDLHSMLLAHKSWFEYQALRAGRARISADDDPRDAKLLDAIVEGMRDEHERALDQLTTLLDTINRELSILAELPGKRMIPFTKERRSAEDLREMAQEMVRVVEKLANSVSQPPRELGPPGTVFLDKIDRLDLDLRILRWHLERDERLEAIASARELGVGSVLGAIPAARELGSNGVLIALTDKRVLVADLSEFRKQGLLRRTVPNADIRYVRFREDDGEGQAEVDLITKDDNLSWRFADGSSSEASVRSFGALLADRMDIPQVERDALRPALPPGPAAPKELPQ
jgi:hypothetical protein